MPLLHCRHCGGTRSYRSSGRIRVNANGKLVDARLIYRCTSCDGTWNRPVLERRHVRTIDPDFLAALSANDARVASNVAFDRNDLGRWTSRLEETTDIRVTKEVLSGSAEQASALRVLCTVPHPVALRLDRLLAEHLQMPRSRIHVLEQTRTLTVAASNAARALRKPVREGMEVRLALPVPGAGWIARIAACDASHDR
jgi:hypothetical protein